MSSLLICLLSLLSLGYSSTFLISASLSPGSYYNNFCQLTVSVISNTLYPSLQIFNLISAQNILFWDKHNPFYTKGIDWRWDIAFPDDDQCIFKRTPSFYCAQIVPVNDGTNFTFMDVYNSSLNNYTFRVSTVQCPSSARNLPMSLYVQVPLNYSFYIQPQSASYIHNLTQAGLTSSLSFMHTQLITVDTSALQYLQASINIRPQKYYLVGCLFEFSVIVTFNDVKYTSQWQVIQINFTNIRAISIDLTKCGSSCQLTGNSLTLSNPLYSEPIKSFIPPKYNIMHNPFSIIANFSIAFLSDDPTGVLISVLSSTHNLSQNVSSGNPSLYTYEMAALNTTIYGQPSDSITLLPSALTVGSCASTVSSAYKFYGIGWIVGLIVMAGVIISCRKEYYCAEKYIYLVTIFLEIGVKIVYICLEKENYYKTIALSCFIIEISLNFIYFFQYAFLFNLSQELFKNISKHFSVIISLILLFLNYKSYALILQKLIDHKQKNVRYSNDSIYLTHFFHLGLSMLIVFVQICLFIGELVSLNVPIRAVYIIFLMWAFLMMALTLKIIIFSLQFKKLRRKINHIVQQNSEAIKNT